MPTGFFNPCTAPACLFDRTPTVPILLFEALVLMGVVIALWVLPRFTTRIGQRFALIATGIFIFEFFTSPMWNNFHMGVWAYVYRDVSWILTLGWTALVLSAVVLVDHFLPRWREWQRFLLYLLVLTVAVILLESLVLAIGLRSYSPEVLDALIGLSLGNVPIEVLYYVPVFLALVIGFYKYWAFHFDALPEVPVRRPRWVRNLLVSLLGVVLFELMIEPMVQNVGFPRWSYFYRDLTFLMTGLWIVIIWLVTTIVDRLFLGWSLVRRFVLYLAAAGALFLPLEAWFIRSGFRVYGPSAVANFSGYLTPFFGVPIEVAVAVPFYLALIIAFIRHWELAADNRLTLRFDHSARSP